MRTLGGNSLKCRKQIRFSIWFRKYCSLFNNRCQKWFAYAHQIAFNKCSLSFCVIGTTTFLYTCGVFFVGFVKFQFFWRSFFVLKKSQNQSAPPNFYDTLNSSYIDASFFKYIIIEIREYKNAGCSSVNWITSTGCFIWLDWIGWCLEN